MCGCGHAGPSRLTSCGSLGPGTGRPRVSLRRNSSFNSFAQAQKLAFHIPQRAMLRTKAKLVATQSKRLLPCVVSLQEGSLALETLLASGPYYFKQGSHLRADGGETLTAPVSGCAPSTDPQSVPAEATMWEKCPLSSVLPGVPKQRFPEAQRLPLLPVVPASAASSSRTVQT